MLKRLMVLIGVLVLSEGMATKINQGVILEQREWVSGTTPIEANEYPYLGKKKLKKSRLNREFPANDGDRENVILVNRIVSGLEGRVGRITEIGGTLEVYIENSTPLPQIYRITSNFCLSSADPNINPCYHATYKIELDPYGMFQLDVARRFSYKFPQTGVYGAGFYLMTERENSTTYFATYDLGEVIIT